MSQDELFRKGQDVLQIVSKAKEFTEEVLKENERLRYKLASLEAGGGGQAGDERAQALQRRVRELEEKLAEIEARYRKVEEENKEFADRYIEIEEQNNNLANLYVASYQLHSTLDYREVVRIVQEIVINLIGAEAFHILIASEKTGQLEVEASEGQAPARTSVPVGDGIDRQGRADRREPLRRERRPQGAVAVRGADRGHPPEDQGLDDRRHLDQQAPRPEDAVHDDGLRAVHSPRRPRRDRDLLGEALLDLGPEAHDAAGLPGHAEAEVAPAPLVRAARVRRPARARRRALTPRRSRAASRGRRASGWRRA